MHWNTETGQPSLGIFPFGSQQSSQRSIDILKIRPQSIHAQFDRLQWRETHTLIINSQWRSKQQENIITQWQHYYYVSYVISTVSVSWRQETSSLQWRHNERDGISNHWRPHCLLHCRFRRVSKKILKLRVTGLCAGNSPVTVEFPAQTASNAENVSIWWRHHVSVDFEWITTNRANMSFKHYLFYVFIE